MEFLNLIQDTNNNDILIFSFNSDFLCDCYFCSNRDGISFSLMALSDILWGINLPKDLLMEKFQEINPLIDCNYEDALKMIKCLFRNHLSSEIIEIDSELSLSFSGFQFDVPIQWKIKLEKLNYNEMFHHFVKPLMGALSQSNSIGNFLWDKWKSTRLYLDYLCLNNSIKADMNKSFLNIPTDYSDLENIVETDDDQKDFPNAFPIIQRPFEKQIKRNCEKIKAINAGKSISNKNSTMMPNDTPIKFKSENQQIRLKQLAEKLEHERIKPKAKRKKII